MPEKKNSRIRYLVITEKFPPRKGGSNTTFDAVYRRLGDRTTHIVANAQPDDREFDADHPNTVHRLNLNRQSWIRPESLGIYTKLFFMSMWLAFSRQFDAVHAGRVLSEGLVGLLVARLRGLPLVIWAHGEEITSWRQPLKFRVMAFTYRHADRILANSEFTRDELLKLGVIPERFKLIYPGVDVDIFRPGLLTKDLRASLCLGDEQRLILSVGRLTRRKSFDQVVRALSRLVEEGVDVHYAIVGIGEDEAYLKQLAVETGVAERVHLLGHVPMEDLPRWYCAADLFAMPNRNVNNDTEGFGKVYLEAAACGRPAIAGLVGGTGAAVLDRITGLRVDGESLEAVTNALRLLLNDTELARRLGEQGRRRAVESFSWEQVARQKELVFREMQKNIYTVPDETNGD
jgi:phosphatidylinositol alpha-1,6-mannosyltransferase